MYMYLGICVVHVNVHMYVRTYDCEVYTVPVCIVQYTLCIYRHTCVYVCRDIGMKANTYVCVHMYVLFICTYILIVLRHNHNYII